MFDDALESRIRDILQATPVEQLGTITAKDVRARLLAEGAVDEAWVKANKKAVNALIAGVFEEVSAPLVPVQAAPDYEGAAPKQEEEEEYTNGYSETYYSEREGTESQYADEYDNDEAGEENGGGRGSGSPLRPAPVRKPHKKKSKRELTDEEYARRLSSELNGRPRSSRLGKAPKQSASASSSKKGGSRTPKRNKKSTERVLDSDGEGDNYSDAAYASDGRRIPSKPAKKKKSRKGAGGGGDEGGGGGSKGGFKKEYILSVPLSALLEVDRLSRPQVVKQLWDYIKGNNLQNPHNRKEILCDDLLRPIFNADKIDMFKMNKVLGQHLHEVE